MALEGLDVAAAVKGDKGGFVEADAAFGSHDLRAADAGNGGDSLAAGAIDAFEKLKAGKVHIAHEDDGAAPAFVMKGGGFFELGDLILVAHFDDGGLGTDVLPDEVDDVVESRNDIGGGDEVAGFEGEVVGITGPDADAVDHGVCPFRKVSATQGWASK